jgi:hypothetical protein
MNLLLHCGSRRVEREQLESFPTPASTRTWQPVPHHVFLKQVESAITSHGLALGNQAHALWRDGKRYFGLMEITDLRRRDYGLVIGLRNSHDKALAAGVSLGSCVTVCDNLLFTGDVVIARKHTRFVTRDLPELIDGAIVHLMQLRKLQDERIQTYKAHFLSDRIAHDLAVCALDEKVIPVTRMPLLLEEWRRPRHREFRLGGRTVWRFCNAVSEAAKGNLAALPQRSAALHRLLDAECHFNQSQNLN